MLQIIITSILKDQNLHYHVNRASKSQYGIDLIQINNQSLYAKVWKIVKADVLNDSESVKYKVGV